MVICFLNRQPKKEFSSKRISFIKKPGFPRESCIKTLTIDQIFKIYHQLNLNPAKDREATKSTPKKAKKRGAETGSVPITLYFPASPALSVKKRTRSARMVPEKPQKGNFEKMFS
jgi:hypothetical protein